MEAIEADQDQGRRWRRTEGRGDGGTEGRRRIGTGVLAYVSRP